MALQPVLPSLIGEGRSARVANPSARIPDMYSGLAKGAEDVARVLDKFGGMMAEREARVRQEKDSLLLEQAMADYDEEVSFNLQDRVFSLSGESAAGAGEMAGKISFEAAERQQEKLSGASPQVAEKFRLFVQKDFTSRGPRVMAYEQAQLRSARVSMNEKLLSSRTKAYAETGEPWYLAGVEENFQAMTENSGQRVITPEKMEVFNSLYDKGEIVLQGEKLKIVDGPATEPGTISREQAADLHSRLHKDMEWYAAELQSQFDAAHSARVDAYLANEQIKAAADYLEAVTQSDAVRGMSQEAKDTAMGKVNRHLEVQAVQVTGQVLAEHTLAAGLRFDAGQGNLSQDGRYWTVNLEQSRLDAERDLLGAISEADPDTRPKLTRALNMFRQRMSEERAMRQETEKADILALNGKFRDGGLFDPYRIQDLSNEVAKMPDSPVKTHFQNVVARAQLEQQEAFQKTPEYKRFSAARMAEFKRYMSAGEPLTLDGVTYDLNNPDHLSAAVRAAGFGPEAVEQIRAYNSTKRVPYHKATALLAEAMNEATDLVPDPERGEVYFTEYNVTAIAPEILEKVESWAKFEPTLDMDSKEGADWMKGVMRDILTQTMRTVPGGLWAKTISLADWVKQSVDEQGNIVDKGQKRDYASFLYLAATAEQLRSEQEVYERVRRTALRQPAEWTRSPVPDAAAARAQDLVPAKVKGADVYIPRKEMERREMEKRRKDEEKNLKGNRVERFSFDKNPRMSILLDFISK